MMIWKLNKRKRNCLHWGENKLKIKRSSVKYYLNGNPKYRKLNGGNCINSNTFFLDMFAVYLFTIFSWNSILSLQPFLYKIPSLIGTPRLALFTWYSFQFIDSNNYRRYKNQQSDFIQKIRKMFEIRMGRIPWRMLKCPAYTTKYVMIC